jgi:hypothetical protein
MRVEFHRAADEEKLTVATADWDGTDVTIRSDDDALREALARAFRRTPVVVADDASLRRLGTHGEVVVNPGNLEWFRAAAQVRATSEAVVVARFVPGVTEGGFDPASDYRTFDEQIERLDARTRD